MPYMLPPEGAKGTFYGVLRVLEGQPVPVADHDVAALEVEGWTCVSENQEVDEYEEDLEDSEEVE